MKKDGYIITASRYLEVAKEVEAKYLGRDGYKNKQIEGTSAELNKINSSLKILDFLHFYNSIRLIQEFGNMIL